MNKLAVVFLTIATSSTLLAQESSLTLGVSVDSAQGRALTLDATIPVDEKAKINLGGSSSRNLQDTLEQTTRSLSAGAEYSFNSNWSGNLSASYWGTKDALEARTLKLGGEYRTSGWTISLIPHFRQLEFTADNLPASLQRRSLINDLGASWRFSYLGFEPWSISLGFENHRYSQSLSGLGGTYATSLFSDTTLSLSSTLISSSSYVEVGYDFERFYLGIELSESLGAIDGARTQSVALSTSFDLTSSWSTDLQIGASRTNTTTPSQQLDPVSFINTSISYFWD